MKNKFRSFIRTILFLIAGVLLLWYVTKDQDIDNIWLQIKSANFLWVGIAMMAGFISHILRALRWNQLIESISQKPRLRTTFFAVMVGYLMNLVVPRLGEVSRCGALNRSDGIPFDKLIGTVIAERAFDLICLIVLVFTTVMLQFGLLQSFLNTWLFDPISQKISGNYYGIMVISITGLILFALLVVFYFVFKKQLATKKWYKKISRIIKGFWLGILSIKKIKNKPLFLAYSVLIWTFYFFMTYLIFFALPATSHLQVADGFTLLVAGSIGIAAPVPGGIGAYHFLIITALVELFTIPEQGAVSFAYLSHTSQMGLIIVLGLFSLGMLVFERKKNKTNVSTNQV